MGQEEVYEVLNVLEFNRWDGLQYVVGSRILVNVTWKKHDWKECKHQETEQQEINRWNNKQDFLLLQYFPEYRFLKRTMIIYTFHSYSRIRLYMIPAS